MSLGGDFTPDGVRDDTAVTTLRLSDLCKFTKKQLIAAAAVMRHKFTLFGGARGPGKSYWLRWMMVCLLLYWAGQGHLGVNVAIFCEDYPTLRDRQITKVVKEFPDWLGTYNVSTHEFTLRPDYGGGVICFRNLDKVKDAAGSRYQSAEFAAIGVDELTKNTIDKFNALRGSLRWTGIDHTPFLAASNPGSIGHSWVKDIWVDGTFQNEETRPLITGVDAFKKRDFAYVRAVAYDNPHLSTSYLQMLKSLPPRLRAAFLDGNWDVFEGQAFDEWHKDIHVVPNRILAPKYGYQYLAGLDWGMRKGAYALAAIAPSGNVEVVWERVLVRKHADIAAQDIAHASRFLPKPEYIYYDDQMDQDHGIDKGVTLLSRFRKGLIKGYGSIEETPPLVPAAKGKGSRKTKYDLFHDGLAWGVRDPDSGAISERDSLQKMGDGLTYENLVPWCRPRLTFQERCQYLTTSIPALPINPNRPDEDIDSKSDDHGYDAVGNILLANPDVWELPADDIEADVFPGLKPTGRGTAKRKPRSSEVEAWENIITGRPGKYELPTTRMPRERVKV